MKRTIAFIIAAATAFSTAGITTFADEEYPEVNVVIKGKELESDQPTVIIDGRTMVPMRAIGEALGAEVDWEAGTKTAVFSKDGKTTTMTIGENVLNVTEGETTEAVKIDAPAVIINGRTLVPVRFISENFSAEVNWDGDTKTVTVTSGTAAEKEPEKADEEAVTAARTLLVQADNTAHFLLDYTDKMTDEQSKTLNGYVSTVEAAITLLNSDSQSYSSQEIESIKEELGAAVSGLESLVKDLGLEAELEAFSGGKTAHKDDEDADLNEKKQLILENSLGGITAAYVIDCLDGYIDDMTDEQTAKYEDICGSLRAAADSIDIDGGSYTLDELRTEVDTINYLLEKLESLADEMGVADMVKA